jgi:Cu(I)/Ag(I) efflux system membrane fusion protein
MPRAHAAYRLSTSVPGVDFAGATPAPGQESGAAATDTSGPAGEIRIDAELRQSIGVRVAPVARRDLTARIRAQGQVSYDETRKVEVSPKYAGWVREIRADFAGRAVRRGEVLCTVYSPELLAAQQEYLAAARLAEADSARPRVAGLVRAGRERLRLWDLTEAQIDQLERTGVALESVPLLSPATGVVLEKSVVKGSSFTAGQMLFRIASTDPVWVTASVYQFELPQIRTGMAARVRDPDHDTGFRSGVVSFVAPALAGDTRTGEARVTVPNGDGKLKPGMFVEVELTLPLKDRLCVPASAVIFSGERRVVFVDLGGGRLAPREVRLGRQSGDLYELLGGLKEGERVVTSGNFLVASESRLKAALDRWEARP